MPRGYQTLKQKCFQLLLKLSIANVLLLFLCLCLDVRNPMWNFTQSTSGYTSEVKCIRKHGVIVKVPYMEQVKFHVSSRCLGTACFLFSPMSVTIRWLYSAIWYTDFRKVLSKINEVQKAADFISFVAEPQHSVCYHCHLSWQRYVKTENSRVNK